LNEAKDALVEARLLVPKHIVKQLIEHTLSSCRISTAFEKRGCPRSEPIRVLKAARRGSRRNLSGAQHIFVGSNAAK